MKVTYIGAFDAVKINGTRVANGETVEVDDDLGASLCEQTDAWKPARKGAKTSAAVATDDTAADAAEQKETP